MNPLHDYIVIEPITEEKQTNFTVQQDEPTLSIGKVIAYNGTELKVGDKVLYKKYAFDEHRGQLIGRVENVIAIL
jgi:co-chaperonin GroES (HSP10)